MEINRLTEILSFYYRAIFRKFRTPLHSEPATPLLWHRCFPVNFAKFLRTSFLRNTSWRLLLHTIVKDWNTLTISQKITILDVLICFEYASELSCKRSLGWSISLINLKNPEAIVWMCSQLKVFLEISQNSQEITWGRAFF